MTNRENYKNAFSGVRMNKEININMNSYRSGRGKRTKAAIAAVAACMVLLLGSVTAYAANIGGIRENVQVWLHGDMTEVTIEQVGDGQFEVTYPDGSTRSTGGMAEDGRGGMRGVTIEEIKEHLRSSAEIEQDEDGNIWLYLRDHKIDLTDRIEENGWAQEKVKDGLLADYITVVWGKDGGCGYSMSHTGFPSVEEVRQDTMTF